MKSIEIKKSLVVCFIVLVAALSIWLVPFVMARIELARLEIKDISKIIYVQYEDMPLSSEVKSKKIMTAVKDEKQIKDFVNMVQEGDIKLKSRNKKTSDMLFLYFEDDRVVNAYVADNSLGFQYGKYWVELEDIDSFITLMENIDDIEVEVKELSRLSIPMSLSL